MDPGVPASLLPFDEVADRATLIWYQSAIECSMWPALHTRLDFSEAIGVLSRYCNNLGHTHVHQVKDIFRYMEGLLTIDVTFKPDSPYKLIRYTNSDWAGMLHGRKSTSGYVWMLLEVLSRINQSNNRSLPYCPARPNTLLLLMPEGSIMMRPLS